MSICGVCGFVWGPVWAGAGGVVVAVIAAEGGGVEVSGLLEPLQAVGHGCRGNAFDLAVDDPLMAKGCHGWGTRLYETALFRVRTAFPVILER